MKTKAYFSTFMLYSILCLLVILSSQSLYCQQQTYSYTGNNQTFIVPAGVTTLTITATGGSGGDKTSPNTGGRQSGGRGAVSQGADIPVSAGDILNIVVGKMGTSSTFCGGGGGGSGVYNLTSGQTLIVGGAGGGAGANQSGGSGIISMSVLGPGGSAPYASGGGGATTSGTSGPGGSRGGGRGEPSGGLGGSGGTSGQAGDGGFGFGGGGGGLFLSGGGGGGSRGGNGGSTTSYHGKGGYSYIVQTAISPIFSRATRPGNGSVEISWTIQTNPPVPTLSQWGLIVLALLMGILATVAITVSAKVQTTTTLSHFSIGSILPFEKKPYIKILSKTLGIMILTFSLAIIGFDYELTRADVPGILITCTLFAYLVHLWMKR